MMNELKVKVGDWVRFYNSGILVIGKVEYIEKEISNKVTLNTDAGRIYLSSVLEVRKP